jgi:hypothetical protein
MSVLLWASISAALTGRISVKSVTGGASIKKSIKKFQISSKSGKKYRPLYVKTEVRFVVFDTKSPSNNSLRVKLYGAVRVAKEVQILRERASL